jgi:hypothetical protein
LQVASTTEAAETAVQAGDAELDDWWGGRMNRRTLMNVPLIFGVEVEFLYPRS